MKDGWNDEDFKESLQKHGFEHRRLATIILNCKESSFIQLKVDNFIHSICLHVEYGLP